MTTNRSTDCPTFKTLAAAIRWADGMQHRGRPCRGVVFHGEEVGTYLVARIGQVNAMVAAGFDAVR